MYIYIYVIYTYLNYLSRLSFMIGIAIPKPSEQDHVVGYLKVIMRLQGQPWIYKPWLINQELVPPS